MIEWIFTYMNKHSTIKLLYVCLWPLFKERKDLWFPRWTSCRRRWHWCCRCGWQLHGNLILQFWFTFWPLQFLTARSRLYQPLWSWLFQLIFEYQLVTLMMGWIPFIHSVTSGLTLEHGFPRLQLEHVSLAPNSNRIGINSVRLCFNALCTMSSPLSFSQ